MENRALQIKGRQFFLRLVFGFSLLMGLPEVALAQSLSTIEVGADSSTLKLLGTEPVAEQKMGPHTAVKYLLPDTNFLSVTYRQSDKKIVFIESDWGGTQAGSFTDFREFRFGKTTLNDIRKELGHNGMGYLNGPSTSLNDAGDLLAFNSFNLRETQQVVTFVTKLAAQRLEELRKTLGDEKVANILGEEAKLDGIILADSVYLDGIWGTEKIRDDNYKPIEWSMTSTSPVDYMFLCRLKDSTNDVEIKVASGKVYHNGQLVEAAIADDSEITYGIPDEIKIFLTTVDIKKRRFTVKVVERKTNALKATMTGNCVVPN